MDKDKLVTETQTQDKIEAAHVRYEERRETEKVYCARCGAELEGDPYSPRLGTLVTPEEAMRAFGLISSSDIGCAKLRRALGEMTKEGE